jgi:hypothetical protein
VTEQPDLVRDLVEQPPPNVDGVRLDLARQAEHLGVTGVRRREGGRRVEHARPRNHQIDADLPSGACVAIGHVRRRLLVAAVDDADLVARVVEGVVRPVELHPGDTEDRVDTFAQERLNERLATGKPCHQMQPPSVPPI